VVTVDTIKSYGKSLGIDKIRIAQATPFTDAYAKIAEQVKAKLYLGTEHWQREDLVGFCDPHSKLAHARSIIAACQCYLTDEASDQSTPSNPHGLISRYTWRNHYLDLRQRLNKLAQFLKREAGAQYCVFSNGPLAEKPIAQRCGIGYYGKHCIIITPEYGSWVVLGEIVTDIEIEPDPPLSLNCGDCTLCMEACPTNALIAPYVIDRRRCIQALTNWVGIIPDEIARVWGRRLYGCMTCQTICPQNTKIKPNKPRTDVGYVGPSFSLFEILTMTEKDYRSRYPNNQVTAQWIRFKAIQRNALLCLAASPDTSGISVLKDFAMCSDRVLAQTAQWALQNRSV
jgi:epoxyqueuosine reductase